MAYPTSSRQGLTLRRRYAESLTDGTLDAYRKKKWDRSQEFVCWLGQVALESLDPIQAMALYRASGGRYGRAFQDNRVDELRDSLDFLLYDTINLEGRFDECAAPEGAYKLVGAGKEFISYLLCLQEPGLLGVWNANSERLLRLMGAFPPTMNRGPIGVRYIDLLDALNRVRFQLVLKDFREVDEMAFLAARP